MTWSYDATSTTLLNKVRRRIGDTDTNRQLLTDEEIADFTSEYNSDVYLSAAACCDAIIAKLARDIDRSNLGMSATRSQVIQHYTDLGARLRQLAGSETGVELTGVSQADADTYADDSDFRPPKFTRDWGTNNG